MTREVTRAIDKKNGDEVIYRDDKIAFAGEASGATDITSQCEYLIKNGQTGEFMNVLKSYIDESVRSALGALVNNLDKGTTIKSVLATDSSNDLGSITPANLASVLGVHGLSNGRVDISVESMAPNATLQYDLETGRKYYPLLFRVKIKAIEGIAFPGWSNCDIIGSSHIGSHLSFVCSSGVLTITNITNEYIPFEACWL